jgi:hypothetical protein
MYPILCKMDPMGGQVLGCSLTHPSRLGPVHPVPKAALAATRWSTF